MVLLRWDLRMQDKSAGRKVSATSCGRTMPEGPQCWPISSVGRAIPDTFLSEFGRLYEAGVVRRGGIDTRADGVGLHATLIVWSEGGSL
jgi:hypothetical protein